MHNHTPKALKRARRQRRQMSPAEIRLWCILRTYPGGRKYRKLHPFGDFVADFYCDSAKMIIEVDGESHSFGDQPAFDAKRDSWFASQGIRTIRVQARDVFRDMESVMLTILSAADAAGPPPPLKRSPAPQGGGFHVEY